MKQTRGELASTGVDVVDEMVGGGLPTNRATLVTGGPGTGKSTLGMQFLQAGLAAGQECLYVSTEQTIEELTEAFSGFDFDLDHENLEYATIHASHGKTIEDEDTFTLETHDESDWFRGFETPFTGTYIEDHLRSYTPIQRVVFDSTSGLAVIAEDVERYRRLVFDLIRFFTDEVGATTMFTAEDYPDDRRGDVLQFTAHGVIALETDRIEDSQRRFLSVPKMRGVDHDRRRVELTVRDGRLTVGPQRRSHLSTLSDQRHCSSGIEGIDRLTGGGLVRGAGVLLTHDSHTPLTELLGGLLDSVLDEQAVALVAPLALRERRLDALLERFGHSLSALLDADRLFVLDQVGGWDTDQRNVFPQATTLSEATQRFETVESRVDGAWTTIEDTAVMAHTLDESALRSLRYKEELMFLGDSELLVHLLNPAVVDNIAAFYRDSAEQIIDTGQRAEGLRYLTLRKSPTGHVGSSGLLNPLDEPPYVRLELPAGTR